MLLEHAQQGDLKTFLRERRPLEKIQSMHEEDILLHIKLVVDIACGMDYVSQLGVMHRDLAARNCFVMSDQTVKIGDFGRSMKIRDGTCMYVQLLKCICFCFAVHGDLVDSSLSLFDDVMALLSFDREWKRYSSHMISVSLKSSTCIYQVCFLSRQRASEGIQQTHQ